MYAQHLANNYGKDQTITNLVNRRDIYIIPMVNVDGSEFDISHTFLAVERKKALPFESAYHLTQQHKSTHTFQLVTPVWFSLLW